VSKARGRIILVVLVAHREFTMSDDSFADFRQADGRFATGNPDDPGQPRARDQMAALEQRVAEASDESIEAALTAAKAGNVKAIEMLLNRIWPARAAGRSRSRRPKIRGTSDLVPATAAIINAVLNGDVTPREGAEAARMIQAHGSVIDLVDHEQGMLEFEEEGARQRAERR